MVAPYHPKSKTPMKLKKVYPTLPCRVCKELTIGLYKTKPLCLECKTALDNGARRGNFTSLKQSFRRRGKRITIKKP